MKYEISTGPALLPVSLSEAKAHLRVDGTDEDSAILAMLSAATNKVEKETGRALISQTVKAYWDRWPQTGQFELPVYPANAVTAFNYIDADGTTQAWPSGNYRLDAVGITPRVAIVPEVDWPEIGDYPNAISITYTAGVSNTTLVPDELKYSILTTAALLYERREDMPLNGSSPGVRTAAWLSFTSRSNLI